MDDIDKEISFLDEKIKELSNASMRIKEKERQKTSTPVTARDSGIGASEQRETGRKGEYGGAKPKVKFNVGMENPFETLSAPNAELYETEANLGSYPETPRNAANNVTVRRSKESREQAHFGEGRAENKATKTSNLKPATYDGTTSWLDYRSHFNACASLNKWSEEEKGMYLAVSLRGQAQGVLGNLPDSLQMDFKELSRSLEERFSPMNQTELYRAQLKERRQKATETLPQLGQDIRRLTRLAYPTASADVCETLAKEYFIDSLSSFDMRLRIKQAGPEHLNDARRHVAAIT